MAQSCIRQLEEIQFFQKSQIEKLQLKVKNSELTIESLQSFINLLIELNSNLEIPVEIRNFLLQLNEIELNEDRLSDISTFTKENNDRIVSFIDSKLNVVVAANHSSSSTSSSTCRPPLTVETITFLKRIREHLLKNNLNLKLRGGGGGVDWRVGGRVDDDEDTNDVRHVIVNDDSGVSTPVSP